MASQETLLSVKGLPVSPLKLFILHVCECLLVAQSCPVLCDPMDCNPSGSSVHGDSPGKDTGMGSHFLLQGIFPTRGSTLGLLNHRQIVYRLSHQSINSVIFKRTQKRTN